MEYINNSRNLCRFFPKDLESINLTPWKARQINRFIYPINDSRVKSFTRFKTQMKNIIVWGKNIRMEKNISAAFGTMFDHFFLSGQQGPIYGFGRLRYPKRLALECLKH